VWGDETLSPRERSILTLGMVAGLGKMGEFANHVRGSRVNGLTPNDLRAVLIQISIYCGTSSQPVRRITATASCKAGLACTISACELVRAKTWTACIISFNKWGPS
jgi:hypothetical protein